MVIIIYLSYILKTYGNSVNWKMIPSFNSKTSKVYSTIFDGNELSKMYLTTFGSSFLWIRRENFFSSTEILWTCNRSGDFQVRFLWDYITSFLWDLWPVFYEIVCPVFYRIVWSIFYGSYESIRSVYFIVTLYRTLLA